MMKPEFPVTAHGQPTDLVGPVLQRGATADAVVAAIKLLNGAVEVLDRGAYLRVMVPYRCLLTREAVEQQLRKPFRIPADLELIMSSFKGRFRVSEDEASWDLERA
jgi:hypothetical protein